MQHDAILICIFESQQIRPILAHIFSRISVGFENTKNTILNWKLKKKCKKILEKFISKNVNKKNAL